MQKFVCPCLDAQRKGLIELSECLVRRERITEISSNRAEFWSSLDKISGLTCGQLQVAGWLTGDLNDLSRILIISSGIPDSFTFHDLIRIQRDFFFHIEHLSSLDQSYRPTTSVEPYLYLANEKTRLRNTIYTTAKIVTDSNRKGSGGESGRKTA